MWPQYRFWEVIWSGYVEKDLKKSQRKRAYFDREIASIEPLVESVWQYFVMLYLFFSSPKCFGGSDELSWKVVYFYLKVLMSWFSMFFGTFNFGMHGPVEPIYKTEDDSKVHGPKVFIRSLVFLISYVLIKKCHAMRSIYFMHYLFIVFSRELASGLATPFSF